jgi:hypothetical protein
MLRSILMSWALALAAGLVLFLAPASALAWGFERHEVMQLQKAGVRLAVVQMGPAVLPRPKAPW